MFMKITAAKTANDCNRLTSLLPEQSRNMTFPVTIQLQIQ